MIDRLGRWAGHCVAAGMEWFESQSGGVQFVIVLLTVLLVAVWIHRAEIRREAEWAEFRAWQRVRRRPLKGRRV